MANLNDVMEMAELLKSKSVIAIEDHCVAVRNRNASCRKCAQVCIAGAITIDKNEINIDAGVCVGCGACVAVCPTAAIVSLDPMDEDLALAVSKAMANSPSIACIACARIASKQLGDPDKYATVPCLGRVDEPLLIALAAAGVQDIVLVDGTCSTCKFGKVSPFVDDVVNVAADMLEMQGCEAIVTRASEFPPELLVEDERKAMGAARRGFFTQAGGYARNVAVSAADKAIADALHQSKQQKLHTLRERLGAGKSGKMPTFEASRNMTMLDDLSSMGEPVVPELFSRHFAEVSIDPEKCSGCGMCVLFCPTSALKYSTVEESRDEERRVVEFQVADCVQCNLCADVCLRECLEVSPMVSTAELFDFEPRLMEIPRPKKGASLFKRHGK